MDEEPLHKLCYNLFITTKHIIEYLNKHGKESALATNPYHGMTPLHMLLMNPHHLNPLLHFSMLTWSLPFAWIIKGSSCWTMHKITMLVD
jgi:hypothetical protein